MKRPRGCWEGERQEAGEQERGNGSLRGEAATALEAMLSMLINIEISLLLFLLFVFTSIVLRKKILSAVFTF